MNKAEQSGGALYISQSAITIEDSVVNNNSAKLRGSAIFMNTAPAVELRNNTFMYNNAEEGATIYSIDSNATVYESVFSENISDKTPGIAMLLSNFTIHETHFSN